MVKIVKSVKSKRTLFNVFNVKKSTFLRLGREDQFLKVVYELMVNEAQGAS